MKKVGLLFIGLILFMGNCTYDAVEKSEITDCSIDEIVKSREKARALILGKWNWVQTTYNRRGVGITTETPNSTGKVLTFKFFDNKVQILENNNLTEETYEIKFWGEGTNTVDEILVVRFFKLTGEFQGTSLLFLNASGTCLTLVNSYNDIGGDLKFIRAD